MTHYSAVCSYAKRSRMIVWVLAVVLAMVLGLVLGGCSESAQATVPDVTEKTLSDARDALKEQGFSDITSVDKEGKDTDEDDWVVLAQDPQAGESVSSSTEIKLTIGKDVSRISEIATKGRVWSEAKDELEKAGFTTDDYEVKSDTGKMVLMASNWIVQSVTDGDKPVINVRKESDIKAEEEAKKQAEEEAQKKAEEEAAQKAAEEEAARKAAEEQAAAAEAQRQAEAQAQQQAQQQQQQQQAQQNVYYANCDAVRAAGAAPLYQGQPGYSTKLDRDRDGIACE